MRGNRKKAAEELGISVHTFEKVRAPRRRRRWRRFNPM